MNKTANIFINKKFIFLIIIIFLIIYFGFLKPASIVQIEGVPIQKGTFTFAGREGTYETPYLNCITSSETQKINSGNNGETTLCNILDDGTTLHLKSSINEKEQSTSNYIKTKIKLPAGTLKAQINYNLYSYYSCAGFVTFKVAGETKNFQTPCASDKNHYNKGTESFQILLDREQEIEISISERGETGKFNVMGEMSVTFTPAPEETEHPYEVSEEDLPPPQQNEQFEESQVEELTWFEKLINWIISLWPF